MLNGRVMRIVLSKYLLMYFSESDQKILLSLFIERSRNIWKVS